MPLSFMIVVHRHGKHTHIAIASNFKSGISTFLNSNCQEISTSNKDYATQDAVYPTVRFGHVLPGVGIADNHAHGYMVFDILTSTLHK